MWTNNYVSDYDYTCYCKLCLYVFVLWMRLLVLLLHTSHYIHVIHNACCCLLNKLMRILVAKLILPMFVVVRCVYNISFMYTTTAREDFILHHGHDYNRLKQLHDDNNYRYMLSPIHEFDIIDKYLPKYVAERRSSNINHINIV